MRDEQGVQEVGISPSYLSFPRVQGKETGEEGPGLLCRERGRRAVVSSIASFLFTFNEVSHEIQAMKGLKLL